MNTAEYNKFAGVLDEELAPQHEWTEPREIKSDLPRAPAFDASALLPKLLADFVLDEADRMPCPPDFVASALLVALGAVIGAKCGIKPKRRDDWIVTPNLYGGVVGEPIFIDQLAPTLDDALKSLALGISVLGIGFGIRWLRNRAVRKSES